MEKSILITFKGEIAMDNNAPVIDTKKNAAKFYKVVETYIKRDGINDHKAIRRQRQMCIRDRFYRFF